MGSNCQAIISRGRFFDEDGDPVDQPQLAIAFDGDGRWTIKLVEGPEDAADLFGEVPALEDIEA